MEVCYIESSCYFHKRWARFAYSSCCHFVGTACVLPLIMPDPVGIGSFMILPMSFLGDLYFSDTLAYTVVFFIIAFLAGGTMGCMTIPFALFLSNRALVVLSPFVVCALLAQILNNSPWYSVVPTVFMRAGQDFGALIPEQSLFFILLVFAIVFYACVHLSKKDYLW